jgi:hypothetical protein
VLRHIAKNHNTRQVAHGFRFARGKIPPGLTGKIQGLPGIPAKAGIFPEKRFQD